MKRPVHAPATTSASDGTQAARARPARTAPRQELIEQLQLHQVELEQQNEELRASQRQLAAEHARFVDLFDHAPVGYLTLDGHSRIADLNSTAAGQFGLERHAALGDPFQRFVVPADGDRWQRARAQALRGSHPTRIELQLRRQDGREFHAQLDCLRVRGSGAAAQLRVTITDVSQRKAAETSRRIAVSGNLSRVAERRRVAYGLHEDLGQRLCALKVELAAFESAALSPPLRGTVDVMAAQLDAALEAVRRMSTSLHPLILDNLGLAAAMEWLQGDAFERLGLEVELQMDETPQVDEVTAIAIYHLAEALLVQIARQLRGAVHMELLQRPRDLVLRVRCQSGCERPGGSAPQLSDVPEAIRDQVHLLEGRLELDEPAPGSCRISIFLPIARTAAG